MACGEDVKLSVSKNMGQKQTSKDSLHFSPRPFATGFLALSQQQRLTHLDTQQTLTERLRHRRHCAENHQRYEDSSY